jgi:CRP/FNR family transcriptional regulator
MGATLQLRKIPCTHPAGAIDPLHGNCHACNLNGVCLPASVDEAEMPKLDNLVSAPRALMQGCHLYRTGTRHTNMYVLRRGFLKSSLILYDGTEQVIGFHLAGDVVGWDGIDTGSHACDVMALETSEVCSIPYDDLEVLCNEVPQLQKHVSRLMSKEITHERGIMLLLGSMKSQTRLAVFLLNLSQRLAARGQPARRFALRMTRHDIGSYLGLTIETISRTLSGFKAQGIIDVHGRDVEILDMDRLRHAAMTPNHA